MTRKLLPHPIPFRMQRRTFLARAALAMAAGAGSRLALWADAQRDLQDWPSLAPEVRRRCEAFLRAYPEVIERFVPGEGRAIFARLRSGERILAEDFATDESHEERLENPDLLDMVSDPYPATLEMESWPENLDPGRYRCEPFLKAVYGGSEAEVRANLDAVPFCGHRVSFNRRNGAAEALRRVGVKLEVLATKDPGVKPHVEKLGGGFNWRVVAGTNRLSSHSFALAIDLNPGLGGYWRWESNADRTEMRRRRAYPAAIVEAFEREGFIWGGKWYHFDLMHFEFRPEFFG